MNSFRNCKGTLLMGPNSSKLAVSQVEDWWESGPWVHREGSLSFTIMGNRIIQMKFCGFKVTLILMMKLSLNTKAKGRGEDPLLRKCHIIETKITMNLKMWARLSPIKIVRVVPKFLTSWAKKKTAQRAVNISQANRIFISMPKFERKESKSSMKCMKMMEAIQISTLKKRRLMKTQRNGLTFYKNEYLAVLCQRRLPMEGEALSNLSIDQWVQKRTFQHLPSRNFLYIWL